MDNKFLRNDSIFLICRSGARSHDAADFLQKNGFNNVYNVIEGFEGKKKKLAWSKRKNLWVEI